MGELNAEDTSFRSCMIYGHLLCPFRSGLEKFHCRKTTVVEASVFMPPVFSLVDSV